MQLIVMGNLFWGLVGEGEGGGGLCEGDEKILFSLNAPIL